MAIATATRKLWPGKGEPTDYQLLQQACDGEQVAFETLVQRYQRALYRFVSARLDSDQAQDVVQFVLLQLYLAMPRLRESIRKSSSLKPWLLCVARNRCVDEQRRKKRYIPLFSTLEVDDETQGPSPLEVLLDPDLLPEDQIEAKDSVPTTANTLDTVREAVVAKVKPSVVQVNVTTAQGAAIGSGVIIDPRGYIVTNNHVVSGARSIQVVLFNSTKKSAQLAGADAAYDLAVLKIAVPQSGLSVATLGDSTQLQVGQEVLVIGNPLGITQTVTDGIVSALKRSVSEGQGGATIQNAIQTDAPINPGNSGGALVDLQGDVVGIPTLTAIDPEFKTPANGVGFAIPANRVKAILPQIIQG